MIATDSASMRYQYTLDQLYEDPALFVIAHREEAVRLADEVLAIIAGHDDVPYRREYDTTIGARVRVLRDRYFERAAARAAESVLRRSA